MKCKQVKAFIGIVCVSTVLSLLSPITVLAGLGFNPVWETENTLPGFNPVIEYTNETTQTEETEENKESEQTEEIIEDIETEEITTDYSYDYDVVLTKKHGVINGPSGKETFYNLDMSGVISIMGDDYGSYWVRNDGCKMLGEYVMVAADFAVRPRGTIVETTLGQGIVVDTGEFIYENPYQLDIATVW